MSQAVAIIEECGPQWGGLPTAALLEAHGDLDGAARLVVGAWDRAERDGYLARQLNMGPTVVRLALATGARRFAESVTDTVELLAVRARLPKAEGAARLSRGRLSGDPGLLLAAADAHRRSHHASERACAGEEAGAALVCTGRAGEAGPHFDDALGTYERLGAERDIARLRATMRELGVVRGSRSRHRQARSGWESLTATERRVVGLVTEGLTNPEIGRRLFISPRTVQSHLSHVFTKLNVVSRVELVP